MTDEKPEVKVTDKHGQAPIYERARLAREASAQKAREAAEKARGQHDPKPEPEEEPEKPVDYYDTEVHLLTGGIIYPITMSAEELGGLYGLFNNDVGTAGNIQIPLKDGKLFISRVDNIDYILATKLESVQKPAQ